MKVLIWDFDGTLAHRPGLWSGALLEALSYHVPEHGLSAGHLRPHLQSGFPWHVSDLTRDPIESPDEWWSALEELFVRAYTSEGIADSVAREAARSVRARFVDPHGWHLFEDALPALEAIGESGWTQVVLSNHVPELPGIVAGLGLTRYIGHVFTSAALGAEKPHPAAFQAVLDAHPNADRVIMIGDNVRADIEGARAAGIEAILVRTICEDLESIGDLRELPDRLDRR